MDTICLFASDYAVPQALQGALKNMLALPEYYGMNADALNDCLSEMTSCPGLWFRADGEESVNAALRLAARVFEDNGAKVKEL